MEPLIYTLKGNLPEALLVQSDRWEVLDTCVKLTVTHTLDGEVVKEAVHVLMKKPAPGMGVELEQM